MVRVALSLLIVAVFTAILPGAENTPGPSFSKTFDQQAGMVEREFVSLAEAMPEDKYSFAPTSGEFKGVRTFAQQVTHVATVNYGVAAHILGEKTPVEMGSNENGSATLKTKADIVKYLKDSFAYVHKAMNSVTAQNVNDMVDSPFGKNKVTRLSLLAIPVWHSFDHYGQMVVYARMNGIVPPASR